MLIMRLRQLSISLDCGAGFRSVRLASSTSETTVTTPTTATLTTVESGRRLFEERRVIGYASSEIYEIVSDVASYEQFLPYCTQSKVSRRRKGRSSFDLDAFITIGFPPDNYLSYSSTVECRYPWLVRSTAKENEILQHLSCRWEFYPVDVNNLPVNSDPMRVDSDRCGLIFRVEYEFKGDLLASAFADTVQQHQIDRFLRRAEEKFGPPSPSPSPLCQRKF